MRVLKSVLYKVVCECGHHIKTEKRKGVQCRRCGRRFDL